MSALSAVPALADDWPLDLRADGGRGHEAVAHLHGLLLRAARFEVSRRRAALPQLGSAELDELAPLTDLERRPRRPLAGQADPPREALVRDAQLHGDRSDRLARRLGKPHGLGPELRAVATLLPPHMDSFPRALPRSQGARKPG